MQYERTLKKWGTVSLAIVIPTDLAKYLDLNPEDTLIIQDDTGKNGKFISMWKKEKVVEDEKKDSQSI